MNKVSSTASASRQGIGPRHCLGRGEQIARGRAAAPRPASWPGKSAVIAALGAVALGALLPNAYVLGDAHSKPLASTLERRCVGVSSATRFQRTELYLGLTRIDGSAISDPQFQHFVDTEITPRFSAGFTVIAANGQFKNDRGLIVREPSRVLVLLYPADAPGAHAGIEAIRSAYKLRFQQQSVLRVDDESCVSF